MATDECAPRLLYGYGVIDANGKPYFDECCVSDLLGVMEGEVELLNDNPDDKERQPYRVVALYYSEIE